VFALVYLPAIQLEQQHLRDLFPEYADYTARVPLMWPRLARAGARDRFRWQLYVRNEEYKAFARFSRRRSASGLEDLALSYFAGAPATGLANTASSIAALSFSSVTRMITSPTGITCRVRNGHFTPPPTSR